MERENELSGESSEQARVMTAQWRDIIQYSNNKHKMCLLKEHKENKKECT